ncbi:peroxidase 1-like [Triticum dicoccoides]|uniref:peroxidase 1-like n=1 Tax=Triticum dicoccoides TaxID=85692 RepID=UPI001890B91F|nr:peroxidase 1-like [Triticum dicoccoides]
MASGSFLLPPSLLVLAASSEMVKIISAAPSLAGPFLWLHFHDCFVRGCDASVLLDSTKGNLAERDAKPNKSLREFGSVERVKARLEAAGPGIVSCADVLTLMARDAVVLAKGPSWPVALGRRDGSVSSATEASDVPLLTRIFASKGLGLKDLVVLSGAHRLSTAHSPSFADRLYNTTDNGLVDPSPDSEYAAKLRLKCKSVDNKSMLSEMDPGSYKTFDTSYYRHVTKRRGLFRSDAALLTDATTEEHVRRVATGKFDDAFFRDFSESMVKMGNAGVLTNGDEDIRPQLEKLPAD